jgi:CHAT domain-containing protein/tetratricopeptide (TPR) repeat protein
MRAFDLLLTVLVLQVAHAGAEAATPGRAQGEEDTAQDAADAVSLTEELQDMLAAIVSFRQEADLETARGILREVVESLGEGDLGADATLLPWLVEMDRHAGALGCLDEQVVLQVGILASHDRRLPPEHPSVLSATQRLATAKAKVGDLAGARPLFEQVLAVRERELPPDHPDILSAKQDMGALKRELGELAGAHDLFEQVHEARLRSLPLGHDLVFAVKQNLAMAKRELGDLRGAAELEEEVLAARERSLPADHPDFLAAKAHHASTLFLLGELNEARALNEEVLAARARLLPRGHPRLLNAQANLAVTRLKLGDLEGARTLFEEVLAIKAERPERDPHLASTLTHLAITKFQLGDFRGARELFEEAIATGARTYPEDHPSLLSAKLNLAATQFELGDLAAAEALFEEVLTAWAGRLPDEHPNLLAAKLNLAGAKLQRGDLDAARELQEEVLAVQTRTLPPDHPDVLWAKLSLGATRHALGDLAGARELEAQVLAARERFLPAAHPRLLATKLNLAATTYRLGDDAGARELVDSLLAGVRQRVGSLIVESPRVAREGALAELERVFEVLAWRRLRDPEGRLDASLFTTLESLRAVSVAGPEVAHATSSRPDLEPLRRRIAALREEMSALAAAAPADGGELDTWRGSIGDLSRERDQAEFELRQALAEGGTWVGEIDAQAVGRGLGEGAVAVSYLRYPLRLEPDPETGAKRAPVESLVAFVVLSDGVVKRVDLGPVAEIEELVRAWRAGLGKPLTGRGLGIANEVVGDAQLPAGRRLRALVLDPILECAGDAQTLHLCLDDVLHLVPFDALPLDAEAGAERVVGDRVTLRAEVSLRRLVQPASRSGAEPTLLLFGGIDYAAEAQGLDVRVADAAVPPIEPAPSGAGRERSAASAYAPLVETGDEVERIAERFAATFDAKARLFTGEAATKSTLVQHVAGARFVHLATHGWFAPEAFRSKLDELEGAGRDALLDRAQETLHGFAQETLCGLALAGANRGRDAAGRVAGILTAEELGMLDLRECELAVLSACETNVGIRRAGQGIQSLQSALHAAGARTAITSLWKVDDAATRRLMELFYTKLWKDGLGKAEALWQAKTALRAEGHPLRDWSGWVLSGDPD